MPGEPARSLERNDPAIEAACEAVPPELHLGPRPDKLVPDLAGWRRVHMPDAAGDERSPAHYDTVPDWGCEVLSPSNEVVDRGAKMPIDAREGVAHAWLVDPALRQREVF